MGMYRVGCGGSLKGQRVKLNPRNVTVNEWSGGFEVRLQFSILSHLLTREEAMMSSTSYINNGGWKKATGRKGWWEERRGSGGGVEVGEGGGVELRGLKKPSVVYLPWIHVLAPLVSTQ